MTWAIGVALIAAFGAVMRSLWSALGVPWRWPLLAVRSARKAWKRRSLRREPDPFEILHVQHRLSALANELRVLESVDADRTYYARAHRIHSRRNAYDQLLAEACKLAGVPTQRIGPDGGHCRSEDQRLQEEMELAARGWSW